MRVHRVVVVVIGAVVAAWVGAMVFYEGDSNRETLIRTFNGIYASGKWAKSGDGKGTSGPGSSLEATAEYRAFLENFIKTHDVKSVVDAGCGDWSFSSKINWGQAHYTGFDISTDVIDDVRKRHGNKAVQFEVGNITESLPSADLLLCKDVLQHLPNELVLKFIKNNLKTGKYKWAIITNDRQAGNGDIAPGEHRPIDLGKPPFEVKALVDLPINFLDGGGKVAQLLDLRRQ
jgi:SAM-dependent methyltransferase